MSAYVRTYVRTSVRTYVPLDMSLIFDSSGFTNSVISFFSRTNTLSRYRPFVRCRFFASIAKSFATYWTNYLASLGPRFARTSLRSDSLRSITYVRRRRYLTSVRPYARTHAVFFCCFSSFFLFLWQTNKKKRRVSLFGFWQFFGRSFTLREWLRLG